MSLDLGAIAKGFAVDLACERLLAAGFTNALVNLGGDLRVMGRPSRDRAGWRAAIRDPFDRDATIGTLALWHGEATATSGNYERFVTLDGTRYAHIMDGRTGWPVTHTVSCTVVAPTAMEADALATTLFVLGPGDGMAFLKNHPNADALWVTAKPNSRRVATPGMSRRLLP
jgi:thiamine biosynthesis lipoprotein